MNTKIPDCEWRWLLDTAEALEARSVGDVDIERIARTLRSDAKRLDWDAKYYCRKALHEVMMARYIREELRPGWKADEGWIIDLEHEFEVSPGLVDQVASCLSALYSTVSNEMAEEFGVVRDTFPKECPWSLEELLRWPSSDVWDEPEG